MKAVTNGSIRKEQRFPMLMQHDVSSLTVLFTDDGKGTVIATGNTNYCIGYYSDGWVMSGFEPFDGSVTISND